MNFLKRFHGMVPLKILLLLAAFGVDPALAQDVEMEVEAVVVRGGAGVVSE